MLVHSAVKEAVTERGRRQGSTFLHALLFTGEGKAPKSLPHPRPATSVWPPGAEKGPAELWAVIPAPPASGFTQPRELEPAFRAVGSLRWGGGQRGERGPREREEEGEKQTQTRKKKTKKEKGETETDGHRHRENHVLQITSLSG